MLAVKELNLRQGLTIPEAKNEMHSAVKLMNITLQDIYIFFKFSFTYFYKVIQNYCRGFRDL